MLKNSEDNFTLNKCAKKRQVLQILKKIAKDKLKTLLHKKDNHEKDCFIVAFLLNNFCLIFYINFF